MIKMEPAHGDAANPDVAASRAVSLRCQAVRVRFGGTCALDGLDLEVHAGEAVGLVGRNGAGKSTLIRAIAGLQTIHAGSIGVFTSTHGDPPRAVHSRCELLRVIGVVPDELSAWDWMRVQQVINVVASVHPGFDRHWCDELVSLLRLDRAARVASLSRGTRARLAFLLGVVHRPALLLLDEPLLGVDAPTHDAILRAIAALRDETRCTLMMSSHALGDLARVVDRVALIDRGTIIESETVETILEQSRRLVIRPSPQEKIALPEGATVLDHDADALVVSVRAGADRLAEELRGRWPASSITVLPLSLHDAFADRLRVLEAPT